MTSIFTLVVVFDFDYLVYVKKKKEALKHSLKMK